MKDRHLGQYVPRVSPTNNVEGIPSKDNGLDVEGLAVTGNRVFLGLRGPVLRGWASVVELRVSAGQTGTLTLDAVGPSGELYLKHLLQIDGLGVRDLVIHGDDLLVLSGPSTDLDGPVFVYRWKDALGQNTDSLTWNEKLARLVTVPFGVKRDHAEGLSLAADVPLSVLVCYDSPAATRIDGNRVTVDTFLVEKPVTPVI